MSPSRIALFGGTFDPIHAGHLDIARRAVTALSLDRVIFLPCHTSPHKIGVPSAPPEDRLEMVRLATRGLTWAETDDFDLRRPPPSYSYETAEEMARRHPGARLFWLMGADQWRALPRWKNPDRLASSVEFIVFARNGAPAAHPSWRMHAIGGTHPASATRIREELAAGRSVPDGWLPEAVASHITDRGLYKA